MLLFSIVISIFVLTGAEDTDTAELSLETDYSDSHCDVSDVKTEELPSSLIGSNTNGNGGRFRSRGTNHFGTSNGNGNNNWRSNGGFGGNSGFTRGNNGGFSNANGGGFGNSNVGNRGFNGGNAAFNGGNRGFGGNAGNVGATDNISAGTLGLNTRSNGNSASTESRLNGASVDRLGLAEALGRGFGAGLGSAGPSLDTNRIASAANLASLNNLQSRSTSGRISNNFH